MRDLREKTKIVMLVVALAFVGLMVKEGSLAVDLEDEILKAAAVTHGGAVVHEGVRG